MTNAAPSYVQAIKDQVSRLAWSEIEKQTGLSSTSLKEAARTFVQSKRSLIIVGQGVLRAEGGYGTTVNLLELLLLTGKLEQPGCGLAPLAEENNDQGAVEMGTVTEFLPGAIDLDQCRGQEDVGFSLGTGSSFRGRPLLDEYA